MYKDIIKLAKELDKIDDIIVKAEHDYSHLLKNVHPANKKNAINLLHYLALRSLDIRELQDSLHACGLSSMASSESHVRGQLLSILQRIGSKKKTPRYVFSYELSRKSLTKRAAQIFGRKQIKAIPSIMVTFDSSFAFDYEKIKSLLQSGMNVARINCAHDDEYVWYSMIKHVKRASKITGLPCKIYMDLAGPKIRTIINHVEELKIEEGQLIYLTDEKNLNGDIQTIGCTIPGIAEQLNYGETVLIDDGLIEAIVENTVGAKVGLRIIRVSSKKSVIRPEKGINFPDSTLLLPALTDYDKSCLAFIAKHADIVGYSFVHTTNDVSLLQQELGPDNTLCLILKIETPEAVKNLPDLLFSGMRQENLGVMIARGDLAVEIGFERMSEIQEEILWICESAHVPVVWATQVLENLNKSGVATRSEVTDAAHAAMADCVMINKGVYIIRTIETLRDIMVRSGGHHVKKRYTFRPLAIASRFMLK